MDTEGRLPAPSDASPFERIRRANAAGVEYWSGRGFAHVLGDPDYCNFEQVMKRAKTACFNSGRRIRDHFFEIAEMVLDHAGGTELAADVFRATQAEEKLGATGSPKRNTPTALTWKSGPACIPNIPRANYAAQPRQNESPPVVCPMSTVFERVQR
jgi:hypothetical protein